MHPADESLGRNVPRLPPIWRLLDTGRGSAGWNMAVDEALLACMGPGDAPILRFYTWERPTVSLGYFQRPDQELDLPGLARIGGEWVQRPTGGRAVLHDDELTYAVVIREEDLPGTIIETYRCLSLALVRGLRQLGIDAQLSRDVRPGASRGSAACFDAPSWYEVLAEGRKIIGSAQMRRGGTILQHGSIPLTFDVARLLSCLTFTSPEVRRRTAGLLAAKAGALGDLLAQPPSLAEVMQSCMRGFEELYHITFQASQLAAEEYQCSQELANSKYR